MRVVMSESSAKAVLASIQDDPDEERWGRDQWMRNDAIIELKEALERDAPHN